MLFGAAADVDICDLKVPNSTLLCCTDYEWALPEKPFLPLFNIYDYHDDGGKQKPAQEIFSSTFVN